MSAYVSTFDSDKKTLQELLDGIHHGGIQLPDFQRGWVWDDDHIKSLLASLSLSYPVGAVLFLEADGDHKRFLPRAVEGASFEPGKRPELLILDGQQRLTSLYQALRMGHVVETQDSRGRKVKRWYYVDMRKALDPNVDREDAIVSLPEDRVLKTNFDRDIVVDCSTTQKECENHMFPLRVVLDIAERNEWVQTFLYTDDPVVARQRMKLWNDFQGALVDRVTGYLLPIIRLKKETPAEAVAQVFEKVNTGGVALTVFELVTAMFSSEGFRLREDWNRRYRQLTAQPGTKALLQGLEPNDFLTGVALLASYRRYEKSQGSAAEDFVKCKRKDVLALQLAEYERVAEELTDGFQRAAKFLVRNKVFQRRDIPYTTQVVPLAAILVALGDHADYDTAWQKISRWYWCGVFGELYSSSVETRFAKDLPEVVAWVKNDGALPSTILDSNFAAERLRRLRTRNSAAYKGVSALLMRSGGLDFMSGEPIETSTFFDEHLDIHHIFPQAWCKKYGIERGVYNSIVNKTPLSSKTNRAIGGRAPSQYLQTLEDRTDMPPDRMDELLESHLIPADQLREDDFTAFFQERAERLIRLIESATGKSVARDQGDPFDVADDDDGDQEPEGDDWYSSSDAED